MFYHGDNELYGRTKKPHWVMIYLCKKHMEEYDE